MLQLLKILFLFSLTEVIHRPYGLVSTAESNQSSHQVLKSQTDERRANAAQTDRIDISSEKTDIKTARKNGNTKGSSQTLEGCYGSFGRWLEQRSVMKGSPTKNQRCCCRCYCRRGKNVSSDILGKHVAKSEKRCSHGEAGVCVECCNGGSGGGRGKMIEGSAVDVKGSALRSTSTPTEASAGTAVELSATSSTVQHHEEEEDRWKNARSRRPPDSVSPECCCEKYVGTPLTYIFGFPLLCCVKSCNWLCNKCCRCLDKCC